MMRSAATLGALHQFAGAARKFSGWASGLSSGHQTARRDPAAEKLDGLHDTFLERNLRLPAEERLGASDVGPAHLGVVGWQWLVVELRGGTGELDDVLAKFADGHLAW